jgi:hypothetical protein
MSNYNCCNFNNRQQIEQYSNYYYDYSQNNNIENFINANQKLTQNYLAIQQQLLEDFKSKGSKGSKGSKTVYVTECQKLGVNNCSNTTGCRLKNWTCY